MNATIVARTPASFTLQIEIPYNGSMLEFEETLQDRLTTKGRVVTEAACKVIVKQRLCGSGMKWTEGDAAVVLSLRALSYTPERWSQFWSKVDRWGFPVAA
jgi:hypothetical protein